MTYSSGNLIQSTDYNGFVSTNVGANINATWATAYGQTALTTVASAATITATQWASLNSTISSMASHQGTTITSRTNPTAGNIISVLTNVNTDITNCYNNRANAAASGTQYTAWTGTSSKTTGTGTGGAAWTITFTNTVTFANTTAASNFFNAGGLVKIQFSKTSTGTTEDTEWNAFIGTTCGAVFLSSTGASKTINGTTYTGTTKVGGTGTPTILATATGYAQLTGTPATIYKQFDSGAAYNANYVQVNASISGAVITFTTTWFDDGTILNATISGGTATTGITFGTAPTTVVTYLPPETTYLTNTWGTPTVAASVA
jgi:hypothetical protein